MNKKGFTLTELLVVIALISIIVLIAVPSVISISKRINKRVYNAKIQEIVSAAELYGTNNPDLFNGRTEVKVYISELVDKGFVSTDSKSDTAVCKADSADHRTSKGCVVNPVDKVSMNQNFVIIKKEASGVTATYGGETTTITNGTLVEQVCARFDNGMFTGKSGTGTNDYCGCDFDNNGKVIGIYKLKNGVVDTSSPVKACIIAGDETNNYLKYGGTMWRVMGIYNVYDDQTRLVAKMITNDNVVVQ